MFNEIVQDSQDVGVVVDDSKRPDEQFGDSSAALHEIRRPGDLEPETQEILSSMSGQRKNSPLVCHHSTDGCETRMA